jgi:putative colanic acid biosysnthesis UDP-glucose lipid carrier transferase
MARTDHLTGIPRPGDGAGRLGDLVIASALIAVTLPLTAAIALAIKCNSPGPVFVREERVNARGHPFAALKFRSTEQENEPGRRVGRRAVREAHVTRVGSFLRYTRMVNLPQLINVLRGEMSCIKAGPDRPFFLD